MASLNAVLRSADSLWTAEYRFLRADGGYAHALNRGYVVRKSDGSPRRMIGAMIDMTDRRQADRQRAAQLAVTIALDESVSLGEAMPTILRMIGELNGWAFGSLWLVDSHQKILRAGATWHSPAINAEDLTAVYCSLSAPPGDRTGRPHLDSGNSVDRGGYCAGYDFSHHVRRPACGVARRLRVSDPSRAGHYRRIGVLHQGRAAAGRWASSNAV
jgi:hypothetical protein